MKKWVGIRRREGAYKREGKSARDGEPGGSGQRRAVAKGQSIASMHIDVLGDVGQMISSSRSAHAARTFVGSLTSMPFLHQQSLRPPSSSGTDAAAPARVLRASNARDGAIPITSTSSILTLWQNAF